MKSKLYFLLFLLNTYKFKVPHLGVPNQIVKIVILDIIHF